MSYQTPSKQPETDEPPSSPNPEHRLVGATRIRRVSTEAKMGERFSYVLYSDARHKALYGGRGSGKSWAVATYLTIEGSRNKKRIVCARQFQNSIRDSSKELIEKRIDAMGLSSQYTITDRYIFHNGTKSQFIFAGLERNVESIRSLEGADVVWIEEARTISAKSLEILLPTVRAKGSQFIWTWNPEQPTDPVDAYFRKGKKPPRSVVQRVDYNDNPFFYSTEMPLEMDLLKQGNYARYQHVWLGEYDTRYESKVFPNAKVGRIDVPADCPPYYGLDFGFGSDPSFVTKTYVIQKKRQIYIAQEASGRVTMDQLPTLVRSVVPDGEIVRADNSQPGTIEFLETRGINVVPARKGQGSVKSGILFLQGYQIIIDPNCPEMEKEAHLYSWMMDRLTGTILSTPVDANNHGWDSVRYATEPVAIDTALDDDPSGGVLHLKIW